MQQNGWRLFTSVQINSIFYLRRQEYCISILRAEFHWVWWTIIWVISKNWFALERSAQKASWQRNNQIHGHLYKVYEWSTVSTQILMGWRKLYFLTHQNTIYTVKYDILWVLVHNLFRGRKLHNTDTDVYRTYIMIISFFSRIVGFVPLEKLNQASSES